ncbi:MAG: hypothetical protein IJ301_04660 [Clostridia bacterium]|nr:hypothetical protein [Clostridia bacterium]
MNKLKTWIGSGVIGLLLIALTLGIVFAVTGAKNENGNEPLFALSGSGTAANPYTIATAADLLEFRDSVNSGTTYSGLYVKVTANITVPSGTAWTPIGSSTSYYFKGTFDGGGYTIQGESTAENGGLYYKGADYQYLGFFGCIQNATIKDLTLKSFYFYNNCTTSGSSTGGIAGYVASGTCTITNCDVYADSTTSNQIRSGTSGHAGGFIGYCVGTSVSITDSAFYSSGGSFSVYGTSYAGGFIGYHYPSTTATLTLTNNVVELGATYSVYSSSASGGFVGYVSRVVNISKCTINCNAGYSIYGASYAGGVAGHGSGTLTIVECNVNTSGSSAISGSNGYAGGIVGFYSSVLNAANNTINVNGSIQAHYVGGFGGFISSSGEIYNNKVYLKAANSIYSSSSDNAYLGGFIGYYGGSASLYDNFVSIEGGASSSAAIYFNVSGEPASIGGFIGYCYRNITQRNTVQINSKYPFYSSYYSYSSNHDYSTIIGCYIGNAKGYTISNAVVEGTVSSMDVGKPCLLGGIIGYNGTAKNCKADNLNLVATDIATFGGLVGYTGSGINSTIVNSSVSATISTSNRGTALGGLVGNDGGTFENCYVDLDVTLKNTVSSASFNVYGLGYNGTNKNCQYVGAINASATASGTYNFYGLAYSGTVTNCGVIMDITTSTTYVNEYLYPTFNSSSATATDCYVKITNSLYGKDAVTFDYSSDTTTNLYDISGTYSGTKDAEYMKDMDYFTNPNNWAVERPWLDPSTWDFENYWYIDNVYNENDGYPTLFHHNFLVKGENGVTINSFDDKTITATLEGGLSPTMTIRDVVIPLTRSGSGSCAYGDYSYTITGNTVTITLSNMDYTQYLGHLVTLSGYEGLVIQNNIYGLQIDSNTLTAQGTAVIVATIQNGDVYPAISLNTYSAQPLSWGTGTRSGTFGSTTYTYSLNNNALNISISNLPAGENVLYFNENCVGVNVYFSSGTGSIKKNNTGYNSRITIKPDGGKYVSSIKVGSAGENQLIDKTSGYILADGVFCIEYNAMSGLNTIILECVELTKTIDIYITVADMQNEIKESGGASITGVAVQATNGGEVRMTGSDFAEDADEVVLMAVAYAGYQFEKWTDSEGNNLGSALSVRFTKAQIDGKIIIANFEKITNDKVNTETDNTGEFV